MTRLVLVNAIYLKAVWENEFSKEATKPKPFTRLDGSPVEVPTMSSPAARTIPYARGNGWQATELRYEGAAGTTPLAMTLILPDDLTSFESKLTATQLDADHAPRSRRAGADRPGRLGRLRADGLCMCGCYPYAVDLFLPRFSVETQGLLADVLKSLGMPLAFTRGEADFSAIHVPKSYEEILYIAEVIHQANIDVDEKGTEAAAATAVIMVDTVEAAAATRSRARRSPSASTTRSCSSCATSRPGPSCSWAAWSIRSSGADRRQVDDAACAGPPAPVEPPDRRAGPRGGRRPSRRVRQRHHPGIEPLDHGEPHLSSAFHHSAERRPVADPPDLRHRLGRHVLADRREVRRHGRGSLQVANPSIDNLNKITIGQIINIPVPSIGTVIRIEGPDYIHLRLGESADLVAIGTRQLANEVVTWQVAEADTAPSAWGLGQEWRYADYGDFDATGRSSPVLAEPNSQRGHVWRAYRAWVEASAAHPELWTQTVVVEWGGTGPCPAEKVEYLPPPAVAPDGTTYAIVPGMDDAYNSQWSIVATNAGGTPGTGWRHELEPCWEPGWPGIVVGSDTTAYTAWSYRVGGNWTDDEPAELVVAGPEGVRTRMQSPGDIEQAPDGTVFVSSMEADEDGPHEPTFRSMSVAALGPDGNPKPGWPFTTTDASSRPVYGPDGTVYLAQSTDSGDRILALGPDGRMKAGWPYVLPGKLEWTICGAGCANVPDAPLIAPDGSIYDNFLSGIYVVGADGRPRKGWPYLLPKETWVPSACRQDTPGCEGFDPVLTDEGRIYLPRTDGRYATEHDDMMCLLLDGSLCPGWPVRLPGSVGNFEVGARGTVHVWVIAERDGPNPQIEITPDGTILHRVQARDTLSGIADAYGVTLAALLAANPQITDRSLIHPGDLLTIPGGGSVP